MVLESGLNCFSLEQLTLGPRHPKTHTYAYWSSWHRCRWAGQLYGGKTVLKVWWNVEKDAIAICLWTSGPLNPAAASPIGPFFRICSDMFSWFYWFGFVPILWKKIFSLIIFIFNRCSPYNTTRIYIPIVLEMLYMFGAWHLSWTRNQPLSNHPEHPSNT